MIGEGSRIAMVRATRFISADRANGDTKMILCPKRDVAHISRGGVLARWLYPLSGHSVLDDTGRLSLLLFFKAECATHVGVVD